MAEHEKNIDAEIKREVEAFEKRIEAYLNQVRMRGSPTANISPTILGLREKVSALKNRIAPLRR